jgi:hypothetical protein
MKVSDLIRVEEHEKRNDFLPMFLEKDRKTIMNAKNLPIWDDTNIIIPP